MSKQNIVIVAAVVLLIAAGASYMIFLRNGEEGSSQSEVVATVNGEKISLDDFETQLEQTRQMSLQQGIELDEEELKTQVIDEMINRVLIEQEAEKEGITVTEEEVEEEINAIIENIGGREVFEQELSNLNLSEEELRENIEKEILMNKYLTTRTPQDEVATEEEMQAIYDEVSEGQDLPPFEELEEELRSEVIRRKQSEIIEGLIDSLREKADIDISF